MPKKNSSSNLNTGLVTKGSNEAYARAYLPAGNSQFRVIFTETGQEVTAKIRGVLKTGKNNKIVSGKLVLLQRDESSSQEKWFITYVYSDIEIKQLRRSGETVDVKEKVSNVVFVDDSVSNAASNEESNGNDEDFVNGI